MGSSKHMRHGVILTTFHIHHARLIEIKYCIERIEQLLGEPDILTQHVRAYAEPTPTRASV